MRTLFMITVVLSTGCATGAMSGANVERGNDAAEYFEAPFEKVVDATYQALSSLGMYVEDRYRSGLDQVISVQSTSSPAAERLLITIARPEVQGVRVSITSLSTSGSDQIRATHDAQNIFGSIALRLGM